MHSQEPVSGSTIVIEDQGDEMVANRVIASSQELYGRKEQDNVRSSSLTVTNNDSPVEDETDNTGTSFSFEDEM